MGRPLSIVWFERCYLGCVAVGVLNTALSWNKVIATASENPQAAQLGESFIPAVLTIGLVLGLITSALLWYFTARKGAAATKWIITALFVLNVLLSVLGAARGTFSEGIMAVVAIVALVLNGLAVWNLFRPDTKVWFGEAAA